MIKGMMTAAQISDMLDAMKDAPYNSSAKATFKRLSMRFLKDVRSQLGIDADVRFNAGGIAIPGDAILHGDDIYITFGGSGTCDWILYRVCDGRKDYSGGANQQFSFTRLRTTGVNGFAAACAQLISRKAELLARKAAR